MTRQLKSGDSRKRKGKRSRGTGKLSAERIRVTKLRAEALEYRAQGYTFEQIGEHLGVTGMRAHQLISEALREIQAEKVETLRAIEAQRLDLLTQQVFPLAVQGDLNALGVYLKIHDARVRLFGLAAPARHEHSGKDGKPIETETKVIDADTARRALLAAFVAAGVASREEFDSDRAGQPSSGMQSDSNTH